MLMGNFATHEKPMTIHRFTTTQTCQSARVLHVALHAVALTALVALHPTASHAQSQPAALAAARAQAIQARDQFIARVHAAGDTCSITAPTIVIEDVPSYGQYDPKTNTLRTADWALLRPEEKAFFLQLAGPGKPESDAHDLFDTASHKWIFIHELGHWWQACAGGNAKRTNYQVEYGANRISLAYWREVEPGVADTMRPIFQGVLDHMPSPVPAGQSVEQYFNDNYQTLGPSAAYPWFMSRMNINAYEEKPAPDFAAALASEKQ